MKRLPKKLISLGLCAVLAISALAGCGSKTDETSMTDTPTESTQTQSELTHVVLNEVAHSIFYAPMYVAIENGYFEEQGIELELVTGFGVR